MRTYDNISRQIPKMDMFDVREEVIEQNYICSARSTSACKNHKMCVWHHLFHSLSQYTQSSSIYTDRSISCVLLVIMISRSSKTVYIRPYINLTLFISQLVNTRLKHIDPSIYSVLLVIHEPIQTMCVFLIVSIYICLFHLFILSISIYLWDK